MTEHLILSVFQFLFLVLFNILSLLFVGEIWTTNLMRSFTCLLNLLVIHVLLTATCSCMCVLNWVTCMIEIVNCLLYTIMTDVLRLLKQHVYILYPREPEIINCQLGSYSIVPCSMVHLSPKYRWCLDHGKDDLLPGSTLINFSWPCDCVCDVIIYIIIFVHMYAIPSGSVQMKLWT